MQTNTPLRYCILWHQHQPDYRTSEGFRLPWVRLHATKDYADLPRLLSEYTIVHTMNVVPTLLEQLQAYTPTYTDELERISRLPTHELTLDQKFVLVSVFRTAHKETMVSQYARLVELYADLQSDGWQRWLPSAWCDSIVLFHLMWMGSSNKKRPFIASLIAAGKNFTETQKLLLLDEIHTIINDVIPSIKKAAEIGVIELSTTPMHHPILPLVIDTAVAQESMSNVQLPNLRFHAPEDAQWHIHHGLKVFEHCFGFVPRGMWPAEGSVSSAALELFALKGIEWVATDEQVLKNSLGAQYIPSSHLAPHRFMATCGAIRLLFRDHEISDAIGFEYATWKAQSAADDFIRRLELRRTLIINEHGTEALEHMVVPIILDGENCWEFYPNNGEDFLRCLLSSLQSHSQLQSVTCSEATADEHCSVFADLKHVQAGSWIAGNFSIWIGNQAKNTAWSLLQQTRDMMISKGINMWHNIYKAQASDWFWWYDERHNAPHAYTFDAEFRKILTDVYIACSEPPPEQLLRPLTNMLQNSAHQQPLLFGAQSMHRADVLTKLVELETSNGWQRISVVFERWLGQEESCVITLTGNDGLERSAMVLNNSQIFTSPMHDEGFEAKDLRAMFYVHQQQNWHISVVEEYANGTTSSTTTELS